MSVLGNMTVTNQDHRKVFIGDGKFEDAVFTATSAGPFPHTYPEGTLLGFNNTSEKWEVYASGGLEGQNVAKSVLSSDLIVDGATDFHIRRMEQGDVREDMLVIEGGGTITAAIKQSLQTYNIIVHGVEEMGELDNQ